MASLIASPNKQKNLNLKVIEYNLACSRSQSAATI